MAINLSAFAGVAAQFFDNAGNPLSGGLLYSYNAGTTTPATTFTSQSGTVANSNPIVLDSSGRPASPVWVDGGKLYKFVLRTSTGVLLGTWDNVPGIDDPTVFNNMITVTGVNSLSGTSNPPLTGYATGATYSFVVQNANTGPVTISIDGLGSKNITYAGGVALGAGQLIAGAIASIQYDGSQFQLNSVSSGFNAGNNVGINTPALTANNPSARLAVGGDVTLTQTSGSYTFNCYYSGTNARWEYVTAGAPAAAINWNSNISGGLTFLSTGTTTGAAGSNAPMVARWLVNSSGDLQALTNLIVGGNSSARLFFRTGANTTIAEMGPGSVSGDGNKLGITTVSPGTNIVIGTNATGRIEITDATTLVYHNLWLTSQSGTLGYGTGAGGSVTQSTSKSTSVTLNRPCGRITTSNSSLNYQSLDKSDMAEFVFNNSLITADSVVALSIGGTTPTGGSYRAEAFEVAAGSCKIRLQNLTAGIRSEAVQINFAIIRGATA